MDLKSSESVKRKSFVDLKSAESVKRKSRTSWRALDVSLERVEASGGRAWDLTGN